MKKRMMCIRNIGRYNVFRRFNIQFKFKRIMLCAVHDTVLCTLGSNNVLCVQIYSVAAKYNVFIYLFIYVNIYYILYILLPRVRTHNNIMSM